MSRASKRLVRRTIKKNTRHLIDAIVAVNSINMHAAEFVNRFKLDADMSAEEMSAASELSEDAAKVFVSGREAFGAIENLMITMADIGWVDMNRVRDQFKKMTEQIGA